MRLSRLRWARAVGAEPVRVADWSPDTAAEDALRGAESWVFVPDASLLPHAAGEGSVSHTLRELESSGARPRSTTRVGSGSAVAFRAADLPPLQYETVKSYIQRLLTREPPVFEVLPSLWIADASETERPEVVERLPGGPARILDLGCGSGGLGLARARRPDWRLTGVEKDPIRAARARERGGYERVIEGELAEALPALASEGARFDALVFADVLEHLEDPVAALGAARPLAAAGATLLAVVPNVGHLSVARDLLLGRHDPVPAGLCDAGHLRWFTKSFLAEAIAEAGWDLAGIESVPGAPAPDPGSFLALASHWPDADLESLGTYQWIATARAG
jgi:SAM-dependent methyltransferase